MDTTTSDEADPPQPDLFHLLIEENIERLAENLLGATSLKSQLNAWRPLKKFHDMLPQGPKAGRVYVLWEVCKMSVILSMSLNPQTDASFDVDDQIFLELSKNPLDTWTQENWEALEGWMLKMKSVITQKDAKTSFSVDGAQEDSGIDLSRSRKAMYSEKFDNVQRWIRVQIQVSYLRERLRQQLADGAVADDEVPGLDQSELEEFWQSLKKEKLPVRKTIKVFITNGEELKTFGEIRELFKRKPFAVELFVPTFQDLMRRWLGEIFSDPSPVDQLDGSNAAVDLDCGIGSKRRRSKSSDQHISSADSEENTNENDEVNGPKPIEQLKHSRKQLRTQVNDPLQESVAIAEQRNLSANEKDSETYDSGSDGAGASAGENKAVAIERGTHTPDSSISSHCSRNDLYARRTGAQALTFDSPGHESPVTSPKTFKRKFWTDEEKQAVKQGASRFPKQWMIIKSHYDVVLKDRTNVQIKDCYRSMVARGEIVEETCSTTSSTSSNI